MPLIEMDKITRNSEWDMVDLHHHPYYELYFLTDGN